MKKVSLVVAVMFSMLMTAQVQTLVKIDVCKTPEWFQKQSLAGLVMTLNTSDSTRAYQEIVRRTDEKVSGTNSYSDWTETIIQNIVSSKYGKRFKDVIYEQLYHTTNLASGLFAKVGSPIVKKDSIFGKKIFYTMPCGRSMIGKNWSIVDASNLILNNQEFASMYGFEMIENFNKSVARNDQRLELFSSLTDNTLKRIVWKEIPINGTSLAQLLTINPEQSFETWNKAHENIVCLQPENLVAICNISPEISAKFPVIKQIQDQCFASLQDCGYLLSAKNLIKVSEENSKLKNPSVYVAKIDSILDAFPIKDFASEIGKDVIFNLASQGSMQDPTTKLASIKKAVNVMKTEIIKDFSLEECLNNGNFQYSFPFEINEKLYTMALEKIKKSEKPDVLLAQMENHGYLQSPLDNITAYAKALRTKGFQQMSLTQREKVFSAEQDKVRYARLSRTDLQHTVVAIVKN